MDEFYDVTPGDKVVCIEAMPSSLTKRQTYVVQPYPNYKLSDTVMVIDDKGELQGYFKRRFRPMNSQHVQVENNVVKFILQDGPIKEKGVNGCQIDTIIEFARDKIQHFHKVIPCDENAQALIKLEEALFWLDKRTKNREARGVEGTSVQ